MNIMVPFVDNTKDSTVKELSNRGQSNGRSL